MKLIKITLEKNKKLNNSNYSLFRLQPVNLESAQVLGNKIRRTLIKETVRLTFKLIKQKITRNLENLYLIKHNMVKIINKTALE